MRQLIFLGIALCVFLAIATLPTQGVTIRPDTSPISTLQYRYLPLIMCGTCPTPTPMPTPRPTPTSEPTPRPTPAVKEWIR